MPDQDPPACVHPHDGGDPLCPACRRAYDEDQQSWLDFGEHPEGIRRWAEYQEHTEAERRRLESLPPCVRLDDADIPY